MAKTRTAANVRQCRIFVKPNVLSAQGLPFGAALAFLASVQCEPRSKLGIDRMSQVASDAGLSRESLYKALSGERKPTLGTVLRVVRALGLKLRAEAVPGSAAAVRDAPAHR